MGEIADMMLDRILDEQTGEFIDYDLSAKGGPGYPRTMKKGNYNTIKHVRTQDVRIGHQYRYKDEVVTVIKRIQGKETNQRNMQSGELFTGYKREQKKFELSNGDIVKANLLFNK